MLTIREKALSGLRWTAGVRVASQVLTWAMTLVVIRFLSPADYGLLAMATVAIAFLAMVSEIGLGPAIVQKAVIEPEVLSKIFGLVLTINIAICILLSIAAPAIAAFYQEDRLVTIIQVMSLQFVVSAIAVVPDSLLQRAMEFRKRSLIDFGGSALAGVTTLACAYSGLGVWSLVAGSFVSQLYRAVGLNVITHTLCRPVVSFRGLGEYVWFGGHISLSGLLWFFFTQADILIAGRWLGTEALGYYAVAMHLASLFNQRISRVVNQVAFPTFAHMQHDLPMVGEKVLLGARLLCIVAFPCLWGISSVAPEIVMLVLGPKWEPAILPLSILTLIMPLRVVGTFVPNALQGLGRGDIILRNALWACAIMPPAYLIGVNWGLEGLTYSWLVGAPLVFLQNTLRSMPALGLHKLALFRTLLPIAMPSLIMYAMVATVRPLMAQDMAASISLPILCVVGAMSYGVASLLLNRAGCSELLSMLRRIATPK